MALIPFPEEFLTYLRASTLVGMKGGTHRDTFLNIWMVEVNGRVFARSWTRQKRSWFTAMLEQGVGQIKYEEITLSVSGKPMADLEMNLLVDQAYRQKYTQEHNLPYVAGITQPEYRQYTMELFYQPC